MKSLGIDDLMKFEWVTGPPAETVLRALENLVAAGMVGEDGRLTVTGEKVAECPVDVNIARMVWYGDIVALGMMLTQLVSVIHVQGSWMWRRNADDCSHDYDSSEHATLSLLKWCSQTDQLLGRFHNSRR